MRIDLSFLPALGAAFLLVFARIGTMLMLLPGLGEQNISARMRLTFALILAAPRCCRCIATPTTSMQPRWARFW
jgi:flagellar biosynthesis protein FliR